MRVEHLRTPTPDEIRTMTTLRDGEVRLGQRVGIVGPNGQTPAGTQVVLVGVPEDIGVRANLGRGGTRRMWRAFLPRFLNMQSNTFLDGATVAVAGCIDVRDLNKAAKGIDATVGGPRARAEALVTLREMVSEIDRRVAHVIEALRRSGVVPIVIGGGHNNAYGILAGCARASGQAIGCVNIDLHADLRPCEGRHSGNAFTYARADGHLDRYAVVGMSEAWATQSIVTAIERDERTAAFTFESMLRGGVTPLQMAELATAHLAGRKATLELDLDAVAQAPASAAAASGFSGAEFEQWPRNWQALFNFKPPTLLKALQEMEPGQRKCWQNWLPNSPAILLRRWLDHRGRERKLASIKEPAITEFERRDDQQRHKSRGHVRGTQR